MIIDNKIQNYVQAKEKFSDTFKDINFILSEDKKNKNSSLGSVKNYNIEELCKLIGEKTNIKVTIHPITSEYYNKNNKRLENREQNIIILGQL